MLLTYRVIPSQWKPDAAFHRLLSVLRAHRSAVDGILLFTEETGVAYTPLEQVAEGAAVLKERVAALRSAGCEAGGHQRAGHAGPLGCACRADAGDALPAHGGPRWTGLHLLRLPQ